MSDTIKIPEQVLKSAMEDRGDKNNLFFDKLDLLKAEFEEENKWHKFQFLIMTGVLPKKDFPKFCEIPMEPFIEEGESLVLKNYAAFPLWERYLGPEKTLDTVSMLIPHIGLTIDSFGFHQGFGFIDNLWATLTTKYSEDGVHFPLLTNPSWTREETIAVADWLNFCTFWPKGYEKAGISRMFLEKEGFFEGTTVGHLNISHQEYKQMMLFLLEETREPVLQLLEERIP